MRRVLVGGLVVGIADGALLGASAALGWTWVAWAALVAGLAGAAVVALAAPPPRVARPATVTLGLPLRDAQAADDPALVPAAAPSPAQSPPAAAVEEYPQPVRAGEPTPAAA
ncbi:hypothetical protein [Krasilnikoviella flava]|uniref:Uncharacterized protein n=1 Tax=Krasilnikoviella flava TaxID=526729 RepID=A0A1T5LHU7_9MICO|nr:hypothetical protein [Krasilnikoviella flava]SKC75592.1 hypothetical protein SAMN04324258_3456 [Krasilnikoviella flava]